MRGLLHCVAGESGQQMINVLVSVNSTPRRLPGGHAVPPCTKSPEKGHVTCRMGHVTARVTLLAVCADFASASDGNAPNCG